MTLTETTQSFDKEGRKKELHQRFREMDPEKARSQLAVLPYYHQLENEITHPRQGIFVSSYFLEKWAPALGFPAASIVLNLQKVANKEGQTYAKYETIAKRVGIDVSTLKRWLSTNPEQWKRRSPAQRSQWQALHSYFIKDKRRTKLHWKQGNSHRWRQGTNLITVAMDDPVHPDDEAQLFVLAAERIANEEARRFQEEEARNTPKDGDIPLRGQAAPAGTSVQVEVDNSPRGQAAPSPAGAHSTRQSLPNRTNFNVDSTLGKTNKRKRPEQTGPSVNPNPESIALMIEEKIKNIDGDRSSGHHKNTEYFRLIADRVPEDLITQALTITRDLREEGKIRKSAAQTFHGIIHNLAVQSGIELPRKRGTVRTG